MAIKLSKLIFALLLFYYGWFQLVFFQIPNIMLLLGVGMVTFIMIDAAFSGTNIFQFITWELRYWILFAFTCLIFGYFVAVDIEFLTSAVTTFAQFIILIYGIIYISNKDGKVDFFITVLILFAIVCAVTALSAGVVDVEGRTVMSKLDNPNALGINMAIGISCVLYKVDFKRLLHSIIAFGMIMLMVYVAFLSGSRKTFISIALIIIYWVAFVAFKDIKTLEMNQKVKGILLLAVAGIAGFNIFSSFFEGSILIDRMAAMFQGSETTRMGMYDVAFDLFRDSPLVGVGLNNYRAISIFGTYSHSTFAEALSCTGLIGCTLYFTPYLITLFHYIKLSTSRNLDYMSFKQGRLLLGLFGVMVFLAIGVIHFYEMSSSVVFGIFFAFYFINSKKLAPEGIENN
jgi:O-antigen ligase